MTWYRRKPGPFVWAPDVKSKIYVSNCWKFYRLAFGVYVGIPCY